MVRTRFTGSKGSFRGELELCMDQHGLLLIGNIATVSSTQSLYVTYLKNKEVNRQIQHFGI